MKKISTITSSGALVLLVASPYIAISEQWKGYILMLCGFVIVIFSLLIRQELHKVIRIFHGAHEIKSDTYSENNPQ